MFIKKAVFALLIMFSGQVIAMNIVSNIATLFVASRPEIKCSICEQAVSSHEIVPLKCGHLCCQSCLLWQLKIATGEQSKKALRCLVEGCKHKFSVTEIELIENKAEQLDAIVCNESKSILRRCPTLHCGNKWRFCHIEGQSDSRPYTCSGCNATYCANCCIAWENHLLRKRVLPCDSLSI